MAESEKIRHQGIPEIRPNKRRRHSRRAVKRQPAPGTHSGQENAPRRKQGMARHQENDSRHHTSKKR